MEDRHVIETREKDIIDILIKYHGQYVTIYDIAQQLAVSSHNSQRIKTCREISQFIFY